MSQFCVVSLDMRREKATLDLTKKAVRSREHLSHDLVAWAGSHRNPRRYSKTAFTDLESSQCSAFFWVLVVWYKLFDVCDLIGIIQKFLEFLKKNLFRIFQRSLALLIPRIFM